MRGVFLVWLILLASVFFVGYLFYGFDGIARGIIVNFEEKNYLGIILLFGLVFWPIIPLMRKN